MYLKDVNMDIPEIIKSAFIFPSKNLETLSIYAILSLLAGAFAFEGVITFIFGIVDVGYFLVGAVYVIISLIIGLITRSISIQCVKSGINLEEKLPDFKWWGSFRAGFNKIIITIVYFTLPAIIVVFVGLILNVFGNLIDFGDTIVFQVSNLLMGNSVAVEDVIFQSFFQVYLSLAITLASALIIFLIFSFFQAMAEARYAHTDSLKEALNIFKSVRDLKMIGVGKVIILSAIIFVIVLCIQAVLTFIFDHLVVLSILNIVITPYLALFGQRALGLLYSDII